jgi:hypothetical protein
MKKTAIFLFWCRTPRLKASHELELVESEGVKVLYQTHTVAVQKFSQVFFFFLVYSVVQNLLSVHLSDIFKILVRSF